MKRRKRGDLEVLLIYSCMHTEQVAIGDPYAVGRLGFSPADELRLQAAAERVLCPSCRRKRAVARIMEAR